MSSLLWCKFNRVGDTIRYHRIDRPFISFPLSNPLKNLIGRKKIADWEVFVKILCENKLKAINWKIPGRISATDDLTLDFAFEETRNRSRVFHALATLSDTVAARLPTHSKAFRVLVGSWTIGNIFQRLSGR